MTTLEAQSVARVMAQDMNQQTALTREQPKCKFCGKTFRQEKTLLVHLCEPKRRDSQKSEVGVQLGFQAYLKFFEMTQGSAVNKTYEVFAASPYYSSFVKFGQYLVSIRAVNTTAFILWIIKSQKKLDFWTKDAYYAEWLYEYLRKENSNDALDRSFAEMQRWADETGNQFNRIFIDGSPNKVCNMIVNGRISPWVILNSSSGIKFLSTLNEEQISMIYPFIDPQYWERRLSDYVADTEFMKMVLKEAQV